MSFNITLLFINKNLQIFECVCTFLKTFNFVVNYLSKILQNNLIFVEATIQLFV